LTTVIPRKETGDFCPKGSANTVGHSFGLKIGFRSEFWFQTGSKNPEFNPKDTETMEFCFKSSLKSIFPLKLEFKINLSSKTEFRREQHQTSVLNQS